MESLGGQQSTSGIGELRVACTGHTGALSCGADLRALAARLRRASARPASRASTGSARDGKTMGAFTGQIAVSAPAVTRIMELTWARKNGNDPQIAYEVGYKYSKSTKRLYHQMEEEL